MAMSNTYGNTPRPHEGMREVPDREGPAPVSMPDCASVATETVAQHEAQARKLMMGMGESA